MNVTSGVLAKPHVSALIDTRTGSCNGHARCLTRRIVVQPED